MPIENNKIVAPVGVSSVATLIGCASDVGTCCTRANINKWALYKPIPYINSPISLTEDVRKSHNYGNTLNTYTTPNSLYLAAINGTTIDYNPSEEGFFRIDDFNGYNHLATKWITSTLAKNPVNQGSNILIDLTFQELLGEPLLSFFEWDIFDGLNPTLSDLNIGVLIGNSLLGVDYYMPLTGSLTISDYVGTLSSSLRIATSELSADTWYIVPCYTTAAYPQFTENILYDISVFNNIVNTWYPLWGCNHIGVTVREYEPIDDISITLVSYVLTEGTSARTFTLDDLVIKVSNSGDSARNIIVSGKILNTSSYPNYVELSGGNISVPSNSNTNLNIQSSPKSFELSLQSPRITIEVSYQISGVTGTNTQNIFLEYEY